MPHKKQIRKQTFMKNFSLVSQKRIRNSQFLNYFAEKFTKSPVNKE